MGHQQDPLDYKRPVDHLVHKPRGLSGLNRGRAFGGEFSIGRRIAGGGKGVILIIMYWP